VEKTPVPDATELAPWKGRRTEALVCRPSRAGRVFAPVFRWFLHRL